MLYDVLLMCAVLGLSTCALLPLTGGEALTSQSIGPLEHVYRLLLLALIFGFYGWCWTRGGQTLGMTAWRVRVQRVDGTALRWSDALKRWAAAFVSFGALGLGYFWIWFDRDHLAWHDRWTRTRVVVLPKRR